MIPQLNAISITDFRSIRGSITIPLDAPVVLIHGPNGAGKTSVLSALELALTGEVLALRRTDPAYQTHLRNRDAVLAKIVLSETGISSADQREHELVLKDGIIAGAPALGGDVSRFFSERCYLAQATLGRLLEIYQDAEVRQDSPLTRFVKDLLGLDHLDALIEGLHPNADVRNLRRLVPEYSDAEAARAATEKRINEGQQILSRLSDEATTIAVGIRARLAALGTEPTVEPSAENLAVLEGIFGGDPDELRLVALTGWRRDVASLRQRSIALVGSEGSVAKDTSETEEATSREALRNWRENAGNVLEALVDKLRITFPDLPSVASTDPETALRTALSRVNGDLDRCTLSLAADDALASQIEILDQAAAQSQARIALVDEQLGQITGDAAGLSRALAALLPHIHGNMCPVCDRDYSEVSSDPLVQQLSSHVTRLTEQADRLQSLGLTRVQSVNDLTASERERDAAVSKRLAQDSRAALKGRISELAEARRKLIEVTPLAEVGAGIIRREAQARSRLFELRDRDIVALELRAGVAKLCDELKQVPFEALESMENALQRLENYVASSERALIDRQKLRREGLVQVLRFRELNARIQEATNALGGDTALRSRQDSAFQVVDSRRQAAKAVARAAAEARTAIVGRVFNGALNKIWRDLFVRLAPTEPYVPAFRLPQSAQEPVIAQLETVHRDGGRGGAPGAMLSAGNLNTAALTLFTALHLAVKPQLPWLILDDPVQSMDELHIAQFAALLRTLSKEHGRKIVMAVHERQLFDYLALELSPAFDGDQLITVEISRSLGGASLAEPTYKNWVPDSAVAA